MNTTRMRIENRFRQPILFGVAALALIGAYGLHFVPGFGWLQLVLAAGGLSLAVVRQGTDLDLGEGQAIRWWGVLVPMTRVRLPLADFREVHLSQATMAGPGTSYVYRVSLGGHGAPTLLTASSSLAKAQKTARQIAAFLQKPLVDKTGTMPSSLSAAEGAAPVSIPADEAKLPLLARLSRTPLRPPSRTEVEGTRAQFENGRLAVWLRVPNHGKKILTDTVALVGFAVIAIGLSKDAQMPLAQFMALPLTWAMCAGALALVVALVIASSAQMQLEVSPTGITVTQQRFGFRFTEHLPIREIGEIEVSSVEGVSKEEEPHSKLLVTTASGTTAIGDGMSCETLNWLRQWILYALAGGSVGSSESAA